MSCRVCQNRFGVNGDNCPTPNAHHECIDYGDPRPCCYLAERARDEYDRLRTAERERGRFLSDRDAGEAVARVLGAAAREALRRTFGLG